jgi:hypothetical protein
MTRVLSRRRSSVVISVPLPPDAERRWISEYSGALYHATSRGDRREAFFLDDEDRSTFPHTLAEVVEQFN